MRTDKIHAITLRQDGKSYSEISRELGVAKSTLSKWLADVAWSHDVRIANTRRNQSIEKLARLHENRQKMLEKRYVSAKVQAIAEYEVYSKDPHFVSGLAIYRCIGDCQQKTGIIRLSSSDHFPISHFQEFLQRFCKGNESRAKLKLHLNANHNYSNCEIWWLNHSKMPRERLLRTSVSYVAGANKKLQYGVATLIMSNKFLKVKILKWLDLLVSSNG